MLPRTLPSGYYLKTKEGQYVLVRKTLTLALHAVNQGEGPEVTVYTWSQENNNNNEQMAFCFLYKSSYWSPKVAEDGLQMAPVNNLENLSRRLTDHFSNHWFEKDNIGSSDYYSLRSLVPPYKHLCMKNESTQLSLTSEIQESVLFHVTDGINKI